MSRIPPNYETLVQRVLSYIETHLHESISVAVLAAEVGYSTSRISAIFKRETGRTIEEYSLARRIDTAKQLLKRTKLNITEIAFEVGFNSYTRFAIAFKKRAGLSPTAFRKSIFPSSPDRMESSAKTRERFRDGFSQPNLLPCWSCDSQNWRIENRKLMGHSNDSLELTYIDPLPENFAIRLEFQFLNRPHFSFSLHGKEKFDFYFSAVIGKYEDDTVEFIHPFLKRFKNEGLRLKQGAWYAWRLEMMDDTLKVFLNEREIYENRDPFPSRYSQHRHFSVAGWNTSLALQNVSIHDLGHTATVPVVRQADSLYNNAMFDAAVDAYMRFLESAEGPKEPAELRYKIGMCYLRQEKLKLARKFLRMNETLPQTDPWYFLSAEALLEADRIEGDLPVYLHRCRILFEYTQCRDAVRTCIARACTRYQAGGYFEQELMCSNALLGLEKPGTVPYSRAIAGIPDILFNLRRYDAAISLLKHISGIAGDLDNAFQVRVTQADILAYANRMAEAEALIADARRTVLPLYLRVRCDMIEGTILRSRGEIEKAALFLEKTPDRHPHERTVVFSALRLACYAFCQVDDYDRAERTADLALRFAAGSGIAGNDELTIRYPILVCRGKMPEAGQMLAQAAEKIWSWWVRADQMVCAGILFEIGGNRAKAFECWDYVIKRYPEPWTNYYCRLAEFLMTQTKTSGKKKDSAPKQLPDILGPMPYSAFYRAKMFFFVGKLYEKWALRAKARACFELAVAEDPTLNWFTWIAKENGRLLS